MAMFEQIEKEKQLLARCEKSLLLEKVKKRKADTRHKIELGGLVIKSGMSIHQKTIILGGLVYISELIRNNQNLISSLKLLGEEFYSSR